MKKDKVYIKKKEPVSPFEFNWEVAEAFDDMAERSIPGYYEMQGMISQLSLQFYRDGTRIYDLGCSTGTSLRETAEVFASQGRSAPPMVAVDSSPEMIELAREKCSGLPVNLVCDMVENIEITDASVVIASYIIQFTPAAGRKELIQSIADGLVEGGLLLLSEKINPSNSFLNEKITLWYHDFKRDNGYSDLEISQKAEALKNVLLPFTLEEYYTLLRDAGFATIDILMKRYHFTVMAAVK